MMVLGVRRIYLSMCINAGRCLILLLIFLAMFSSRSIAQDPQFSQFSATPLAINPAYTGNSTKWRAGSVYRSQWPGLDHSFETRSVYIDHYSDLIRTGIGLVFTDYRESLLSFKSTEVGVSLAHALKLTDLKFLGRTRRESIPLYMRIGAQYTWVNRTANFNDLIFGDQIDLVNGSFTSPSGEVFDAGLQTSFPSIAAGVLFYVDDAWIGVSVNHLNQPNQGVIDQVDILSARLTIHGGFQIKTGAFRTIGRGNRRRTAYETIITILSNYRNQGKSEQMDLGFQVFRGPVLFGMSYRGIPIRSVDDILNNDALIGMVGLKMQLNDEINWILAYSHDRTVSALGGATGGAHEITLTFRWGKTRSKNYVPPCKGDLNWAY